jgi:hypothetical protein
MRNFSSCAFCCFFAFFFLRRNSRKKCLGLRCDLKTKEALCQTASHYVTMKFGDADLLCLDPKHEKWEDRVLLLKDPKVEMDSRSTCISKEKEELERRTM